MSSVLRSVEKDKLNRCMHQLDEFSVPGTTDIQYGWYEKLINTFLETLGSGERIYIVGSSGEKTKLKFPIKDEGDIDVMLISGNFEVSQEHLHYNTHCPCYVWIYGTDFSNHLKLQLVDEKFISATILREVRPELFSFLRAVYSQLNATYYLLSEAGNNETSVAVSSKVGLAATVYTGLQIARDIPKVNANGHNIVTAPPVKYKNFKRDHKWRNLKRYNYDVKIIGRLFNMIRIPTRPGGPMNGRLGLYGKALHNAVHLPHLREYLTYLLSCMDLQNERNESLNKTFSGDISGELVYNNQLDNDECVKATYKERHHRDIVPALKIKGRVDQMEVWKRRVESRTWPPPRIQLDVFSSDVFVVARVSPINPNIMKDFCLSFNIAEGKLVRAFSRVQTYVYLIMKAYIKGKFDKMYKDRQSKIKTYHVKTVLFWFFETEMVEFEELDEIDAVYKILCQVLRFFRDMMLSGKIPHYFIPEANILSEFEDEDFRIGINCINAVLESIVESLEYFFELDDGQPVETFLTLEEISCLSSKSINQEMSAFADLVEESIVDFYRGLQDVTRDKEGKSQIKEALIQTIKLFLEEVKHTDARTTQPINNFLTAGRLDKSCRHGIKEEIDTKAMFAENFGLPNVQRIFKVLGGLGGLQCTLYNKKSRQPDEFTALRNRILEILESYFTCSDQEEDVYLSELQTQFIRYFAGIAFFL